MHKSVVVDRGKKDKGKETDSEPKKEQHRIRWSNEKKTRARAKPEAGIHMVDGIDEKAQNRLGKRACFLHQRKKNKLPICSCRCRSETRKKEKKEKRSDQ
jgi:hypothetical protein